MVAQRSQAKLLSLVAMVWSFDLLFSGWFGPDDWALVAVFHSFEVFTGTPAPAMMPDDPHATTHLRLGAVHGNPVWSPDLALLVGLIELTLHYARGRGVLMHATAPQRLPGAVVVAVLAAYLLVLVASAGLPSPRSPFFSDLVAANVLIAITPLLWLYLGLHALCGTTSAGPITAALRWAHQRPARLWYALTLPMPMLVLHDALRAGSGTIATSLHLRVVESLVVLVGCGAVSWMIVGRQDRAG